MPEPGSPRSPYAPERRPSAPLDSNPRPITQHRAVGVRVVRPGLYVKSAGKPTIRAAHQRIVDPPANKRRVTMNPTTATTAARTHDNTTQPGSAVRVRQYSLTEILCVWAAAALPMGALAWIVAPWLRDHLAGPQPLAKALLLCFTAGLIWQFVLVMILMRRELGTLRWERLRDALWLRPPRDPKTGKVGGKVWWWALLFVILNALLQVVPGIKGPSSRDFAPFLSSDAGKAFFHGAWGLFALVVVLAVFNTVLGE